PAGEVTAERAFRERAEHAPEHERAAAHGEQWRAGHDEPAGQEDADRRHGNAGEEVHAPVSSAGGAWGLSAFSPAAVRPGPRALAGIARVPAAAWGPGLSRAGQRPASVDGHARAGDPTGLFGEQEQDQRRD